MAKAKKARRPGRYVRHIDGREGIAYNDEQLKEFEDKDKVLVRFNDTQDQLRAVYKEKLKMMGLVD